MNYNVEFEYGAAKYTKTFSSIEELKDFCCQKWNVQRFQVTLCEAEDLASSSP